MPVVVFLAVIAGLGVLVALLGRGDGDLAAWVVRAAAARLPEERQEWGRAMVAELAQIRGRWPRWQFAVAALRIALVPPVRHSSRVWVAAVVGLMAAVGATAGVAVAIPEMTVLVAALGLLLCGYATVLARRGRWPRITLPGSLVAALAMVALGAAVTAVARVAVAHPSAAADPTHTFSIAFALILVGYLIVAHASRRLDTMTNTALWWAMGSALGGGLLAIALAVVTPVNPDGVANLASPVLAATTFVAAAGAAAVTGSQPVGSYAGVLAIVLGAPIQFAVTVTAFLQVDHWTLTSEYDIAAYARSAHPDVASFVLSDMLGGEIIAGLVIYPVLLVAVALLGGMAGGGMHRVTTQRAARTTA